MGGTILELADKVKIFLQTITPEVLHKHRIIRLPERRYIPLAIYLLNISSNGLVAEYKVRLGEFRVYIKVLNLRVKYL
jgi:hypothetical protein